MKFIAGNDRNQIPLFETTLDGAISPDHEIRLIDMFVDGLSFAQMGFKLLLSKTEGLPIILLIC